MSDLAAPVKDGKVVQQNTETEKKSTRGTNELGKEAFLQLLVTQMKYQDPLNPASDTEFVSQLATFSQLEQMQNLNASFTNTQAFTLIGQTVTVNVEDSGGKSTEVQGVVDFVTVKKGEAYLSMDGKVYPMKDLISVESEDYIYSKKAPTVKQTNWELDLADPKDLNVDITMGEDEALASSVAVVVNGKAIEGSYLSYKDGKLTISKDAFSDLAAGIYEVSFSFDDKNLTFVSDKVKLTITGKKPVDNNTPEQEPSKDENEKDPAIEE